MNSPRPQFLPRTALFSAIASGALWAGMLAARTPLSLHAARAGTMAATQATSNVGVPTLTKSFSPKPVVHGQQSTLSLRVQNLTGADLQKIAISDQLPACMTWDGKDPNVTGPDCGVSFSMAQHAISVGSGLALDRQWIDARTGTLPAGADCTLEFQVTTSSNFDGDCVNESDPPSADGATGIAAQDTLPINLATSTDWNGTTSSFSANSNWIGGSAPASASNAVFGTVLPTTLGVNYDVSDTNVSYNQFVFVAGNFGVSGVNTVQLTGGVDSHAGTTQFNAALKALAPLTISSASGVLQVGAVVVNGNDVDYVATTPGAITQFGQVSDSIGGGSVGVGGTGTVTFQAPMQVGSFTVAGNAIAIAPLSANATILLGATLKANAFNGTVTNRGGTLYLGAFPGPATVVMGALDMQWGTMVDTFSADNSSTGKFVSSGASTLGGVFDLVVGNGALPAIDAVLDLGDTSGPGAFTGCFDTQARCTDPRLFVDVACDAHHVVGHVVDNNGIFRWNADQCGAGECCTGSGCCVGASCQ